jgi:hypothetical protein
MIWRVLPLVKINTRISGTPVYGMMFIANRSTGFCGCYKCFVPFSCWIVEICSDFFCFMFLKSIQELKNDQRRIFLDNYYRQRCLV